VDLKSEKGGRVEGPVLTTGDAKQHRGARQHLISVGEKESVKRYGAFTRTYKKKRSRKREEKGQKWPVLSFQTRGGQANLKRLPGGTQAELEREMGILLKNKKSRAFIDHTKLKIREAQTQRGGVKTDVGFCSRL